MQSQRTIDDVKLAIHTNSIADDQQTVAKQWAKTFLHNGGDTATQMTRLLAACVARGDFKVKSYLSSVMEAPSVGLTIADYLSHGSRIIIDYATLSPANKKALLAFFDLKSPEIFSRSATHDVSRIGGNAHEGKGMLIGALGQLPAQAKEPRDFGINIAMGGEGQTNFAGGNITADGYNGHFYFHRNDTDSLLLCGLEQSAPAASLWEAAANLATPHADQFGQSHSLVGASDTYTAAGSLYFSDPHYQVRLLIEKNILPPAKYGSMQVTLNDDNWQNVCAFVNELTTANSEALLISALKQSPTTAQKKNAPLTYIELDFKNYLKRLYELHIASEHSITDEMKNKVNDWHQQLLTILTDSNQSPENRLASLDKLLNQDDCPTGKLNAAYTLAIKRLRQLFQNESARQEHDQHQANHQLFLIATSENLQAEMISLLNDCLEMKAFYQSSFINKNDPLINEYLNTLEKNIKSLRTALGIDGLYDSLVVLKPQEEINEKSIRDDNNLIQEVKDHLQQHLELGSVKYYIDEMRSMTIKHDAARNESEEQHRKTLENLSTINDKQLQELNNNLHDRLNEQNNIKKTMLLAKEALDSAAKEQENRNLTHQQTIKRMQVIAPISASIEALRVKAKDLKTRGFNNAYEEASALIKTLDTLTNEYARVDANDACALHDFKKASREALHQPLKYLYQHRGYKRAVQNILLAICLLGIFYVPAILINKGINNNYLFFNDTTKTAKIRDAIDHAIGENKPCPK